MAQAPLAQAPLAQAPAEKFPKPAPEAAFASLKVERAGSVLRQPREDWDGARAGVKNDAAWREWVARERAEVDGWMSKRSDRVEWVAGWYHDFVSPKDGARLVWTPDEPGPNTLVSSADASEHVALTPLLQRAWVFQFRSTHGDFMLRAARLFRLTGEPKYGEWAASQLDFYAQNFDKWPVQEKSKGLKSRLMGQTLDEAVTLTAHVNAARTLGDFATPERKQLWLGQLFEPEAEELKHAFETIHNIATWHRAAQAQVALYAKDQAAWSEALDGKFGLRAQLRQGVTSDYLWFEQSLGYNSYVVSALLPLFTFASLQGRQGELQDEMHIAQNLMLAPLSIRFPNGQLPTPADSPRLRALDRSLLRRAYRVFPTRIGLEEARAQKSWDTLLDPPEAAPEAALAAPQVLAGDELPPVESRSLESSRMALLKSGPWQLWLHYGQLTASHSQAEALNFEAQWNAIDITHDAGTVGYGSPLHRNFYTRGPAHNALLIDGEGQEKWNPGKLLGFDAAQATVSAEQPDFRTNARARRTLSIENGALMDEASIAATDGKPHALGLTLQLQGSVREEAAQNWAPAVDFAAGRPAAFGYWKDVRVLDAPANGKLSLTVDFAKPDTKLKQSFRVTLTVPPGSKIYQADTPDAPPNRRTTIFVEAQGVEAIFKTSIDALAAGT